MNLYEERQLPIAKICRMTGISKPALYSYVRAANGVTDGPSANHNRQNRAKYRCRSHAPHRPLQARLVSL